jgi:N-acetylglucosamine-6-phosphate deacetylase
MRWGVEPEDMKFAGAPAGIKFALGENVKQSNRGDDFRTRYPQTRMGVDEIINDAFRRARDYDQAWSDWRENPSGVPPRVDLELQALAEILRGERWIHCHSYRQSEILALMATCKRYDVTIGTLQHILEGYKVASEMKENGVMGSSFADWWAYKFEVYDAIPYSGSIMHKAGVVVSFNSDDSELGRRLNLEAAKAVKFGGVPPEEALKFVTLNPAKQLRIADRVGSLAVGKDADLVVWSGSPLSIYTRCEQTWIDGCCYFNLDEDNEMRQRDRARHAALVQKVLGSGAEQRKPGERDRSEIDLWPRRDLFCKCRQASEE